MLFSKSFENHLPKYDLVFLQEIKTIHPFRPAGFKVIRSSVLQGEELRGGVAVMFSHKLWNYVYDMKCFQDQVWFKLSFAKNIQFGAIYVAPRDSPFYKPSSFSNIQEMSTDSKVVLIGDFNARIPNLSVLNDTNNAFSYSVNCDSGVNGHGNEMLNICQTLGIRPINHLIIKEKHFTGDLTFRQKDRWISQLDWAFCSVSLIPHIMEFEVLKNLASLSDHAPLSLCINLDTPDFDILLPRANSLIMPYAHLEKKISSSQRRRINPQEIDVNQFVQKVTPEMLDLSLPLPSVVESMNNIFYNACKSARYTEVLPAARRILNSSAERWSWLLSNKDSKLIWNSINWKGTFDIPKSVAIQPSPQEFQAHFSNLYRPNEESSELVVPQTDVYIPILDDDISPDEVVEALNQLKSDKASGPDGIPPRCLKYLPDSWIVTLTCLFNIVFRSYYPKEWSYAKMFVIYKNKGNRLDPGNYRGISIQSCCAKLYDIVLNNRFVQWYKLSPEQAGGQKGRGCEEQIVTLRLLLDVARKTRKNLYIAFIDYEKAYDKVDRQKLLEKLKCAGCGSQFLAALAESIRNTVYKFEDLFIHALQGVKQGGPTSCPLFTFFIDETIGVINEFGPDGFLGDLHTLLLMDDTAVLATSRVALHRKLSYLFKSAESLGMKIHPTKSQYIVSGCQDEEPFVFGNIIIENTREYTYLGTKISPLPIAKQIQAHVESKAPHRRKFSSFLQKNFEAPFPVKMKVWECALTSSLLYSSESWLTNSISSVYQCYLSSLKEMLSVRQQTPNDLVIIECGVQPLPDWIKNKQRKFFQKIRTLDPHKLLPVSRAIVINEKFKAPMATYLKNLLSKDWRSVLSTMREKINHSVQTKFVTYTILNPELKPHPVYKLSFPEYLRISFTRLRTSSHKLKIETGRWSRIERERRLCTCGEVQTEEHVLLFCSLTKFIRDKYSSLVLDSGIFQFYESRSHYDILKYSHEIISFYQ